MTRYEVKPDYRRFVRPQMLGTFELLEDRSMTCEYVMQSDDGYRAMVTYEFFSECMRPVLRTSRES